MTVSAAGPHLPTPPDLPIDDKKLLSPDTTKTELKPSVEKKTVELDSDQVKKPTLQVIKDLLEAEGVDFPNGIAGFQAQAKSQPREHIVRRGEEQREIVLDTFRSPITGKLYYKADFTINVTYVDKDGTKKSLEFTQTIYQTSVAVPEFGKTPEHGRSIEDQTWEAQCNAYQVMGSYFQLIAKPLLSKNAAKIDNLAKETHFNVELIRGSSSQGFYGKKDVKIRTSKDRYPFEDQIGRDGMLLAVKINDQKIRPRETARKSDAYIYDVARLVAHHEKRVKKLQIPIKKHDESEEKLETIEREIKEKEQELTKMQTKLDKVRTDLKGQAVEPDLSVLLRQRDEISEKYKADPTNTFHKARFENIEKQIERHGIEKHIATVKADLAPLMTEKSTLEQDLMVDIKERKKEVADLEKSIVSNKAFVESKTMHIWSLEGEEPIWTLEARELNARENIVPILWRRKFFTPGIEAQKQLLDNLTSEKATASERKVAIEQLKANHLLSTYQIVQGLFKELETNRKSAEKNLPKLDTIESTIANPVNRYAERVEREGLTGGEKDLARREVKELVRPEEKIQAFEKAEDILFSLEAIIEDEKLLREYTSIYLQAKPDSPYTKLDKERTRLTTEIESLEGRKIDAAPEKQAAFEDAIREKAAELKKIDIAISKLPVVKPTTADIEATREMLKLNIELEKSALGIPEATKRAKDLTEDKVVVGSPAERYIATKKALSPLGV